MPHAERVQTVRMQRIGLECKERLAANRVRKPGAVSDAGSEHMLLQRPSEGDMPLRTFGTQTDSSFRVHLRCGEQPVRRPRGYLCEIHV